MLLSMTVSQNIKNSSYSTSNFQTLLLLLTLVRCVNCNSILDKLSTLRVETEGFCMNELTKNYILIDQKS